MQVKHLNFSREEYDPLSRENALIIYEGELEDGRSLEFQIVYPKRAKTNCYLRLDNREFLYWLNSEMKRFTKTKTMKEFVQFKLDEYLEEQANPKKKKKKRSKK